MLVAAIGNREKMKGCMERGKVIKERRRIPLVRE